MINGGRQPSYGGTSRMNREVHVRICERLGVQLPGATRHLCAGARALGIETSILVLGAFTGGTNHFATRAGRRTRRVSPSMKRVPMPASATRSCKRFPPSCLGMPTLHWSPTRSSMSWIRRSANGHSAFISTHHRMGPRSLSASSIGSANEMLHRVGFSNLLHPRDNA